MNQAVTSPRKTWLSEPPQSKASHKVVLPQDRLGDDYETLAEVLSADGYQCAGVAGGPYLTGTFNLNQGFEYYDESVAASGNEEAHKDVTNPRMAEATRVFTLEGDTLRYVMHMETTKVPHLEMHVEATLQRQQATGT